MRCLLYWSCWPFRAYSAWYWNCVYRARRQLAEDVRRYNGRVIWDDDNRGLQPSEFSFVEPPGDEG